MANRIYLEQFSIFYRINNPLPAIFKNPMTGLKFLRSCWSVLKKDDSRCLPFRLQLETSNVCNLRCAMCPLTLDTKPSDREAFLSFEAFRKIFDQIRPGYLDLTGFGEPFLNKDIVSMIRFAKKRGAVVKVNTNGTLLDEKLAEEIIDTRLDLLPVSVDGATKATYEAIRKGSSFEKVIKGIKLLEAVKRQKGVGRPKVNVCMTLSSQNIHEIPDILELCFNDLGVQPVYQALFLYEPGKQSGLRIEDTERLRRLFINTLQRARRLKMHDSANSILSNLALLDNKDVLAKGPCYLPKISVYIDHKGRVMPCCYAHSNMGEFGNALEEPFKAVWGRPAFAEFRNGVSESKRFCEMCRRCHVDFSSASRVVNKLKYVAG